MASTTLTVTARRGPFGLGLVLDKHNKISKPPTGVAAEDNLLFVGDEVVAVDGVNLDGKPMSSAISPGLESYELTIIRPQTVAVDVSEPASGGGWGFTGLYEYLAGPSNVSLRCCGEEYEVEAATDDSNSGNGGGLGPLSLIEGTRTSDGLAIFALRAKKADATAMHAAQREASMWAFSRRLVPQAAIPT